MNPIDLIIRLFFNDFDVQTIEEDDESLIYKARSTTFKVPSKEGLTDALIKIPDRDNLILMVIIDEGDPYSHNLQDEDVEEFLSELIDAKGLLEDDSVIDIKIEVSKENINNCLTIYFFNALTKTWTNYSIKSFWYCFGRILKNQFINFDVMGEIKPFHSSNMSFSTIGSSYRHRIDNFSFTNRTAINEKMIDNCHFAHSSRCKLIPDDFYLIERSENDALNELFDRFALIQSIIHLFDITSRANDKTLYYKVIGYKQISGSLGLEEFETSVAAEYFKIYSWVYSGGNLSDKIGLARNIVSIHIRNNNPILLTDEVLSSIKSAYDIYLKQNISQYIATKKQVVESLQEISSRANQIVESITIPFRNSFLAIITFFVSMIIIRISLTQSLDHIFTKELAIISFFIIGLSLFYLWLLNREIDIDKARFDKNYENLKSRYEDILDIQDIKKIFNHDRDYNSNVTYIKDKKRRYTKGWIFTHILLVTLIIVLMSFEDSSVKPQEPNQSVNKTQIQKQSQQAQTKAPIPQLKQRPIADPKPLMPSQNTIEESVKEKVVPELKHQAKSEKYTRPASDQKK